MIRVYLRNKRYKAPQSKKIKKPKTLKTITSLSVK
jgi:hypothetical protein